MLQKLMSSTFVLIALAVAAPMAFAETGSETATVEDIRKETRDLLEALKVYGADQREEAIKASREALAALDRRIDALEAGIDSQWDEMDKEARENYRATLKALHKQRIRLAEWYGGWKSSSASAWEHMKKGFSDAYRALSDSWEEAAQDFQADRNDSVD